MPLPGPDGPTAAPLVQRWGHHGALSLNLVIGAVLYLGLRPLPAGQLSSMLVLLAVLVFALGSWGAMRVHDRRLCERCLTMLPLDASRVAERYRLRFRAVHLAADRRVVLGYLGLLVTSDLLWLRADTTGRVLWALVQSTMFYLVLSYVSHRRFQPWCPECRGGGEEQGAFRPDPLPRGGQLV